MLTTAAPDTVGTVIVALGVIGLGLAIFFLVLSHRARKGPPD